MTLFTYNVLQDISNHINHYKLTNKGKMPNYIIINEADSKRLIKAMAKAKLIPDNVEPNKLQIQGLSVIRTRDIPEGYFDVSGV